LGLLLLLLAVGMVVLVIALVQEEAPVQVVQVVVVGITV
jgi:hypothetical protein